ncbi:unnamed protein product [Dimorphilus gyrociliatus]|uniref:Uncharacterized protein n=1 Tax=Dimorphilus gyrociliatus TaxID=2664684 RepID=A0A7I8V7S8_9ANNE|nr:unnamed protein product [Dimorphilus gyrociliatus]
MSSRSFRIPREGAFHPVQRRIPEATPLCPLQSSEMGVKHVPIRVAEGAEVPVLSDTVFRPVSNERLCFSPSKLRQAHARRELRYTPVEGRSSSSPISHHNSTPSGRPISQKRAWLEHVSPVCGTPELPSDELSWAAACGDLETVIKLIKEGRNVNTPNSFGRAPLQVNKLRNRLAFICLQSTPLNR